MSESVFKMFALLSGNYIRPFYMLEVAEGDIVLKACAQVASVRGFEITL